jgi:hypothetical protein
MTALRPSLTSAAAIILMPVTLPFGLLRLLTRLNAMGSSALTKTIGTTAVTGCERTKI